ncbi:MAG: peptidoglycan editing factor PgeF [Gammaproteobacteria bacterium]|nr:peptidoglycan editing factor PgeF [Gammaproteobacteria bacterium]
MNAQDNHKSWIPAKWDAPPGIKAGISTRKGGYSQTPFDEFNLALHVGDNDTNVIQNRHQLKKYLNLKLEPVWLNQVHKNRIINTGPNQDTVADGIISDTPEVPCVILTADCAPLLMCNAQGNKIGAIHVGWRGLVSGIIENAIHQFDTSSKDILVWIGPHIRDRYYEVGRDVFDACVSLDKDLKNGFTTKDPNHWYANLEVMINIILNKQGIYQIFNTPYCTYKDQDLFYSYRRDSDTGRMASMIWLAE